MSSTATPSAGNPRIATMRRLLLLVAAACASLAVPSLASAAAAAPVALDASLSATSFVPAWDGETDSVVVRVGVRETSAVTVTVIDARGVVRRSLARNAVVRADATWQVHWDGRDDQGVVVGAGVYRLSVRASVPQASRAGHRAVAARSAERILALTVDTPKVSLDALSVTSAAVGSVAAHRLVSAAARMSGRGTLAAVVTTADGLVVRNLVRGERRKGRVTFAWDGKSDVGARVADGRYVLLVAASTGGMPTTTLQAPLVVDGVAPVMRMAGSVLRARVVGNHLVVRLPLRVGEAGSVHVRRAGGSTREARRAVRRGRQFIDVDLGLLGVAGRARPSRTRLRVTLMDAAGNTTMRTVTVLVPRVRGRHISLPAQPSQPSTPAPSTPSTPAPSSFHPAWPIAGPVTSGFGNRKGEFHQGIDIGAPVGTPITAASDGIVSFAGTAGGYGNLVIVDHPGGISTAYAHQSSISVIVGQVVTRGVVIGHVGMTGHTTGPHLHFEIRVNGSAQDPMPFMPSR